ncbi:ankyrin repeat-containing domain protein [Aspergillus egyptiacus]|nr:ankyrin repeat-containing domain protein [Aspergillus egyptiacus]
MNDHESRTPPTNLLSAIAPAERAGHPLATYNMIQALETLLPRQDRSQLQNGGAGARVNQALELLMPEEQDGEHQTTSQVISGHRNEMGLQERFKVLFYLLSNNFELDEDEVILSIFRSSGIHTIENMKHLFAMPGLTTRAIAEKLFGSAVRSFDREIITVMLQAGMDPQTLIIDDYKYFDAVTPLEYFCQLEEPPVDMINLLLAHKADVNKYRHSPVIISALLARNKVLMSILISHGADISVFLEKLRSLAERGSLRSEDLDPLKPLLENLLIQHANPTENQRILTTLLRVSVRTENIGLIQLLLARGADVNSMLEAKFESRPCHTTALGLAAEQGATEIMEILLMADATVNLASIRNTNVIQPLTLAVANGVFDAVVLLINCGGDINTSDNSSTRRKTVFDRALEHKGLEICKYLLVMEAEVEEDSLQSFYHQTLCSLIGNSDVESILQLPLEKIDLDRYRKGTRETALGRAIKQGDLAIVKILLEAGATNVGRKDVQIEGLEMAKYLDSVGLLRRVLAVGGQDIIAAAILANDNSLMEYLLHVWPDHVGKVQSIWREALLEAAIAVGNVQALEVLLARGARITDRTLHAAVKRALYKCNDLLLRRIVSLRSPLGINSPDAMYLAVQGGNNAMIKILLDSGIDPRGSSRYLWSALEFAAGLQDDHIFQSILMSADWSKEMLGRAFTASVYRRKGDRMQHLYDAGADLNQRMNLSIASGLRFPIQIAVDMEDISLIKRLIDYGCNPNQRSSTVEIGTPLQIAAEKGNIEIVNLLLEIGADPNGDKACYRTTALQSAVKDGNIQLTERLLDAGSDVNSPPAPHAGATALQYAAIKGFIGIARRLLDEGADVNAGRALKQGRTALEGAAEHGRLDMVQLLLDHGALIEGRGRRQYIRAVKLAEWNAHSTIARFLQRHGQWTVADSQRAAFEKYEPEKCSDPSYNYEYDLE